MKKNICKILQIPITIRTGQNKISRGPLGIEVLIYFVDNSIMSFWHYVFDKPFPPAVYSFLTCHPGIIITCVNAAYLDKQEKEGREGRA